MRNIVVCDLASWEEARWKVAARPFDAVASGTPCVTFESKLD
jgi:hypothetical protein